jgi:membrane-associated phospholipid phosphatase
MSKDAPAASLFRHNAWFFTAFGLFLLAGIPLLLQDQGNVLIGVNDQRHPVADVFFKYYTKVSEGYAQVLIFFLLFFWYERRSAWGIVLGGVLATLVSSVAKRIFEHPRPQLFFEHHGLLQEIEPIPGVHWLRNFESFPSGHTLAAFALFAYLALVLPWKRGFALWCFALALLVGFSRMYLVQHFFKDVYLGAILGVMVAVLTQRILERWGKRPL